MDFGEKRQNCNQNITENVIEKEIIMFNCVFPLEKVFLCPCSKYRTQSSEPQTDGLSVSTTADSSQPNVRKLCDTPPPAPQAHTHNLAYYDNIICQVCPYLPRVSSFFSPLCMVPLCHHVFSHISPSSLITFLNHLACLPHLVFLSFADLNSQHKIGSFHYLNLFVS